MLPYWLFFGFFAAGALVTRTESSQSKRLGALLFAWIIITLMVGLRWEVGPDWASYFGWWERAAEMPLDRFVRLARSDPVFYAAMWFFRNIGLTFWMMNLLLAAIFAAGLVQFSRGQVNPWLSIAVAVPWLVIVMGMSGIRQATAMGFVFLAIVALQRQQAAKFLWWMALAACCHASSILLLPLAGLSFARTRFVAVVLMIVTAVAGYYFLSSTFNVYSDRYLSKINESSGTLFRIGMTVVPAVIYLMLRRHFPAEPNERPFWRNLALVGLLAVPLYFLVASSTALDRLLLYLFPLQMYVFSALPSIVGARGGKLLVKSLIIAYLGLQLFVFLNFGLNRVAFLPYKTILSIDEGT